MKQNIGPAFILTGLLSLLAGILFGAVGALQFMFPDFLDSLPFFKSRPLHVSLVVAWIFSGAIGGIYYYLPKYCKLPLYSNRLAHIHFWMFLITGLLILGSYMLGYFGGREYWAFPPMFAIPIIISWCLFVYNFARTILQHKGEWPVYLWMWATGIAFFFITYLESNLYHLPWFADDVVRDVTVQWKSYGSLVGSWNMMVYGTAIFVMERLSKNTAIAHSKTAYLMYILGLTNLMLGWAHHTYPVPSASWIRMLAYFVSMSELLILGKIILSWKKTVAEGTRNFYNLPFRFLLAADWWVFINLILALIMSVPAFNLYTHGTHVTVAHAMGSTIGINTMILMASVYYIITESKSAAFNAIYQWVKRGFWVANISLLVFWISLVMAGIYKGVLNVETNLPFSLIMSKISPLLFAFTIAGIVLLAGLVMIIIPALKPLYHQLLKSSFREEEQNISNDKSNVNTV